MLLTRRQLVFRRDLMRRNLPDLGLLEGAVDARIRDALREAAASLDALGVPYALVGGLAVGAYGYPRATRDIDFLVGDEAFESHPSGLVTLAVKLPVQVGAFPVDTISIRPDEPHLRAALAAAPRCAGIPVLPLPALIYMKLRSGRRRDTADVVELLRTSATPEAVRSYLVANCPELLGEFDLLATEAASEP